jgi:hypothetical protein
MAIWCMLLGIALSFAGCLILVNPGGTISKDKEKRLTWQKPSHSKRGNNTFTRKQGQVHLYIET